MTYSSTKLVFLFDMDNTLLDNDRIAADLKKRYWTIVEQFARRGQICRLPGSTAAVSCTFSFASRLFPAQIAPSVFFALGFCKTKERRIHPKIMMRSSQNQHVAMLRWNFLALLLRVADEATQRPLG